MRQDQKTTFTLKHKDLLELAKHKNIALNFDEKSNKPIIGGIIVWLRKKLIKRHIEQMAEMQNTYNNLLSDMLGQMHKDITMLYTQLNQNTHSVEEHFFDETYFEGGTKSTYIDYALHEQVFKDFAKIIVKLFKPKKLLDAGCAYGYLVKHLRKLGVEAYGIDISPFAIKKGNAPYLEVGDITNLANFSNQNFGIVLCTEVLEHLDNEQINDALMELQRVATEWIVLTIATKEEEKALDLSHISVHPREYWYELFDRLGLKRDRAKEQYLDNLKFSTRTGWKDHYFVLKLK